MLGRGWGEGGTSPKNGSNTLELTSYNNIQILCRTCLAPQVWEYPPRCCCCLPGPTPPMLTVLKARCRSPPQPPLCYITIVLTTLDKWRFSRLPPVKKPGEMVFWPGEILERNFSRSLRTMIYMTHYCNAMVASWTWWRKINYYIVVKGAWALEIWWIMMRTGYHDK